MFKDYCGGKFIDEYKDHDKAQLAPILSPEEQLAIVTAAFNKMAQMIQNTIIPVVERICTNLIPVVNAVNEVVLKLYPNKRVVYLATHGRWRTRKKNIKRITKWIKRGRAKECLKG